MLETKPYSPSKLKTEGFENSEMHQMKPEHNQNLYWR